MAAMFSSYIKILKYLIVLNIVSYQGLVAELVKAWVRILALPFLFPIIKWFHRREHLGKN